MADFSKDKLIEILSDETKNQWLFSLADKVRQENIGDEIYLRGLSEFSNICKRRCKYCGLRCETKSIEYLKKILSNMQIMRHKWVSKQLFCNQARTIILIQI